LQLEAVGRRASRSGLKHKPRNAPAYKFNNSATSAEP